MPVIYCVNGALRENNVLYTVAYRLRVGRSSVYYFPTFVTGKCRHTFRHLSPVIYLFLFLAVFLRAVFFFADALFFGAAFFFAAAFFRAVFFLGTFAPSFLASDKPIAIACLRLVTFFPLRPLFNVPFFFSCITFFTFFPAFFEYRGIELILMVS